MKLKMLLWDFIFYLDYTEWLIGKRKTYKYTYYSVKDHFPVGINLLTTFIRNNYGIMDQEIIVTLFNNIKELLKQLTLKSAYLLFSYLVEKEVTNISVYKFAEIKKKLNYRELEKTYTKYNNTVAINTQLRLSCFL